MPSCHWPQARVCVVLGSFSSASKTPATRYSKLQRTTTETALNQASSMLSCPKLRWVKCKKALVRDGSVETGCVGWAEVTEAGDRVQEHDRQEALRQTSERRTERSPFVQHCAPPFAA
jgi:hypothetical protein